MALDLSIFEELMQNPDFVNIILPLIFFTTMTFTILQFTLNKMGKENIPLTEKTNIIISLVFGFLATNNEDAVRFLVDHFNLILLINIVYTPRGYMARAIACVPMRILCCGGRSRVSAHAAAP